MSTYIERLPYTGSPEYDKHFWNAMRGHDSSFNELTKGRSTATGLYAMPNSAHNKYMDALEKESLFRSIGVEQHIKIRTDCKLISVCKT